MAALESLAKTNIEVGKSKAALVSLQKDETNYLAQREAKATKLVLKVIEDSVKALQEAGGNYAEIKKLQQMAADFAAYLVEAAEKFHTLYETFTANTDEWEVSVKKTEKELAAIRKGLQELAKELAEEKKGIDQAYTLIARDRIRIKDDTERLARSIERLKHNRV